jgi:hypothetical protein
VTANPDCSWVARVARNFVADLGERGQRLGPEPKRRCCRQRADGSWCPDTIIKRDFGTATRPPGPPASLSGAQEVPKCAVKPSSDGQAKKGGHQCSTGPLEIEVETEDGSCLLVGGRLTQ